MSKKIVPRKVESKGTNVVGTAARQLPGRISDAREFFQAIMRGTPHTSAFYFDSDLRIVIAGGPKLADLGLSPAALEGRTIQEVFPAEVATELEAACQAALAGRSSAIDVIFQGRTIRQLVSPSATESGEVLGGLVINVDVTRNRERDRHLRDSEEQFRVAFAHAPIGMALVGLDGRFLQVNNMLCDITGYQREVLTELTFQDITHPDDLSADLDEVERLLTGETNTYQMEKRYFDAKGHTLWILLSASLVRSADGAPLHFVSHIEDISGRKREEQELRRMAERDSLTGVLNRGRFDAELARHQSLASRFGHRIAVVVFDVDGLKRTNDGQGHAAGDDLLRQVAAAVGGRLRSTDIFARIGGDEFGLLLQNIGAQQAHAVAADLVRLVAASSAGTISAGVAMLKSDASGGEMELADEAMYEAKRSGGNRAAGPLNEANTRSAS
jgi:diguanylate cyclase (GGDEF)-like protein/PAS domain S-box-containing protein